MAFYNLPSEVTWSHFNCALLVKAVESPLHLRETPNSKSWWEECQRMCSHALKLSQCKFNKILLATWKTREQPAVESLPHLVWLWDEFELNRQMFRQSVLLRETQQYEEPEAACFSWPVRNKLESSTLRTTVVTKISIFHKIALVLLAIS